MQAGRGREERIVLAILTLATCAAFTSTAMLGPLLVLLAREFGTTVSAAGQFAGATALTWAVTAPLLGPFSDRYGRRPLLLLGMAGLTFSVAACGLAWDYWSMLGSRLITGVAVGLITTMTYSSVGDYFPNERCGRAIGWMLMGNAVASVAIIPLLALLAGTAGWRWTFAAVAIFLCSLVIAVRRSFPALATGGARSTGYGARFREVLRLPAALPLLGANVVAQAEFWTMTTYLAAYLIQTYGFTVSQVAPILSAIALANIGGSWLGGQVADRVSRVTVVTVTQIASGVLALGVLATSPGLWFSSALAALFGIAQYVSRPSFMAMVTAVSSRARGIMVGLQATTNQAGAFIGSSIGGLVIAMGGYPSLGLLGFLVCIVAAGTVFFAVGASFGRPAERVSEKTT